MASNDDSPAPRRNLHRRDEGAPLSDGGYACLDGEWDEIDGANFGLATGRGQFSKRCRGAE